MNMRKSSSMDAASVIKKTFLVALLVLSIWNCKSPTSPNNEGEADIIVYSKIDEVLDIYMDGVFQFSLNYKNSMEIDNVSFDTHELEAKKRGTEILLDSATIEVEEEIDYGWWIEDPADINVTNSFGETLKIYMDEIYQFDLVDEENRWIIDVSWGEHFLKALRISDGGQVASKTIDITDDLDYTWTIDKPK